MTLKKIDSPRLPANARPWSKNALNLAQKRFLFKSGLQIDEWFDEVARYVCSGYSGADKEHYRSLYSRLLQSKSFLPTSAALANTIHKKGAFAGCIVLPLPLTIEEIFTQSLPEIMHMLLAGIGVGFDFSHFYPRLLSIRGQASLGPVETLLSIAQAVERPAIYAGVKRSAFMATLFVQHPDIFEFICMKNRFKVENVNISVTFNTAFKKAITERGYLPLFWKNDNNNTMLTTAHLRKMKLSCERRNVNEPDLEIRNHNKIYSRSVNGYVGRLIGTNIFIDSNVLLEFISVNAHACGDPGLINLDIINQDNPTHSRYSSRAHSGVGTITTTTPCGEQPLLPYEVCHLGSFNLMAFVENQQFNFALFSHTATIALRFMDDLISLSDNGLEKSNRVSMRNRKIGMGIMGLADVLGELDIPYDSEMALDFCNTIGALLQSSLRTASQILAHERGVYPNHPHSKHAHDQAQRHATLTTIAPTGHIATLADCSFGIEPYYLIEFNRHAAGMQTHSCSIVQRKLSRINYDLQQWIFDTKKRNSSYVFDGSLKGLCEEIFVDSEKNAFLKKIKSVFKTAHEINYIDHLKMVQAWQKHIDNGISKTINLPQSASISDVVEIFKKSLEFNLKGITIFRDNSLDYQPLSKPTSCIDCHIIA